MKSYIVLAVLVCAAGIVVVDHCSGLCSPTDCDIGATGAETSAEYCVKVQNYLDCLTTNVINVPSCSQSMIDLATQAKEAIQDQVDGCSGPVATTAVSNGICAITDCTMSAQGQETEAEYCRIIKPYVDCLTTKMISDPTCPQIVKNLAIEAKKQIQSKLDKCGGGGAAGLVSSLILCLALSGLTYFMTSFK